MNVLVVDLARQRTGEVGGDGLGLRDLLGLETLTLEHVLEVHVAADVQLVRAVQRDTAVLEQLRHHAVGDGGTDLALDVVAHDRHTGVFELLGPHGVAGDEDREGVDKRDVRVDGALCVELVGLLGTDGQVGHEHVDLGVLQCLDDVAALAVGLGDGLAVVLAEPVEGVAPLHGDAGGRHVGDLDGVVLTGEDGIREVEADLLGVHVECGDELDVADVVLAELHVHEARNGSVLVGILVVLHALDQG